MLNNITNITKTIPLRTISGMGNRAATAFNCVQGPETAKVPLKFVAGYNLDHIHKIGLVESGSIKINFIKGVHELDYYQEYLKKGTNQYDEMFQYILTQKVINTGE